MFQRTAFALAALALATPALAAPAAAPSFPKVQDQDMGCVISTGMLAMMADNMANDEKAEPAKRAEALKMRNQSFDANSFFIGRLSLMPPEVNGPANYKAAFDRYSALDNKAKAEMYLACIAFAKDAKLAVVNAWIEK